MRQSCEPPLPTIEIMKRSFRTLLCLALAQIIMPTALHAGLSAYDAAIEADNAGALPYEAVSRETMEFDHTNGIEFDFGEISESSTLEFIVKGDADLMSDDDANAHRDGFLAVGENGTWNLRYEQWDDTGALGFTHLGVKDYLFEPEDGIDVEALNSPTELTHVTYRWDQDTTTMELYLDGVLAGTNEEAVDYEMPTGPGVLGAKDVGGTEGMAGTIERVTVYNDAIDPAAILFHAEAWLGNSDPGVVISGLQDFGELPFVGEPQELIVTIRNSGQENDLTVEVMITEGENFTLVSAPSVVPPGEAGEIKLMFDRKGAIGQFTGAMEVTTNDPDEFDMVVAVELSAALIDREGPIGHYRLDEPAGASEMPDATGFGRNGSYGEGITLGAEALAGGTAMEVGGGSFATIPGEHFEGLSDFTLSLWANASDVTGLQTLIAKGGDASPTFAIIADGGVLQWFVDAGPEFSTDAAVLTANTTHHVAVTYTSTNATLYVDGAPVASMDAPLAFEVSEDNPFMVGAFNTALPFAGRIDDIQIYNRALTEEQLKGLHDAPGSVVTGELSGQQPIAAQWSFDGNLSDTAPGGMGDVLTPTGDAEYALGIVGQAVRITADGLQRLRAPDSDDLDLADNWTLEAFVWPDADNAGEWDRFWTKWGDGGEQWHTSFRSTGAIDVENGLDLFINGGDNIINSNTTAEVPLETWSHVAFVGDSAGGTITAWLNGVQVGSTAYQTIDPGDGAMNFGNFESPGNELQYTGLIDEAIIHAVARDEAYLVGRADLIPTTEPKFHRIETITSSTEADDLFPASNLILGPDDGFDSEEPHTKLKGGETGNWVTAAPGGFPADYIEEAGAPILILDLGADVSLGEISVWGYSSANANGVSEFSLRFATDAEGAEGFGQSVAYNPSFIPTNDDDTARESFFFEETVSARYVEFTAVDNFYTDPGDGSNGEPAGGDRVGLGEIAFEANPMPPLDVGPLRSDLGAVAGSSQALTEPTVVNLGELSGDATYEFFFNAVKGGGSTAITGNDTWALKLDQWQEQGVFGPTEFGVADHIFEPLDGKSVDSVFESDVHVVFVNDTAGGETRLYLNGEQVGVWPGNFELAGEVGILAARTSFGDPTGDGSVMHGWATYNSALTNENVTLLANTPFGSGTTPGDLGPLSAGLNADGMFSITIPDGVTADIEFSIDLIDWEIFATGVSGTVEDADPFAARAGYYRARQQ